MKKLLFFLSFATILSCSSSDDNSDDKSTDVTSDNKIELPTWLNGLYKSDKLNVTYPYPITHPYSLNFSKNDIVVKGVASSTPISMQAFIDNLKATGKLVSVKELNNAIEGDTTYQLTITHKNNPTDSYTVVTMYRVMKLADTNKVKVWYETKDTMYVNEVVQYTKK